MATEDLIIVGAGGFCREVASAVAAVNRVRETFNLLGFVDDRNELHGEVISGVRVLGPIELARDASALLVIGTGNPTDWSSRERIVSRLDRPSESYATVVHPAADIGAGVEMGPGTVVLAGTVATVDVSIGDHVAVMPNVVLTHDVEVGDFSTLAGAVALGGATTIERGAYIGARSAFRGGTRVGERSQVGMGAVVLEDIPPGEVWVGSPARFLRRSDQDHSSL